MCQPEEDTLTRQARLAAYVEAELRQRSRAMELIAEDEGYDTVADLEAELMPRGDSCRDKSDALRKLIDEKIEFLQDNGD